jgi:serine/threonine protein kinase/tetratricopeptide (TPR) repeat protein
VSPCPDEDELAAFVERDVAESRRAEIEQHCEACMRCLDTVSYLVAAFADPPALDDDVVPPALPSRGTTLGRYVILDFIGAGAMGAVYSAFDPELDRRVALKLLPPRSGADAAALRARFLAEARAMASISHPNVIAVHDVGLHGELAFFAMELVLGDTLVGWLEAGRRRTTEIIDVFAAAGRGLAAAHAGGLVHRDFKPENVLVASDGRVRVIDFGLARFAAESFDTRPPEVAEPSWNPPTTQTGALIGTPAYMAPEQLAGGTSSAAADQFAFCVALFEALHGRRPFDGDSVDALAQAIRTAPVPVGPRRVPRRLQRLLARGLSARPEDRWPSMTDVIDELAARPFARWGPVAAVVVAVAGTGFGIHGALTNSTGPRCQPNEAQLADVWQPSMRTELVAAMAADAAPASSEARTSAWLADRFDAYAARWLEIHHDVCVATVERHERSVDVMDREMSCLHRARRQLQANASAAIDGGASSLAHAVALAEGLPELAICEDVEILGAGPEPPTAAQSERVETQRNEIAIGRSELAAGDFDAALRRASEVEAVAREIGYAPLVYEAVLLRGEAAMRRTDHAQAQTALDFVLAESLAARDWPIAIRSASSAACLASTEKGKPEVGLAYARTALGLASRSDSLATSRAHALRCMGRALKELGQLTEAEIHQRAAIALLEREHGDEAVWIAKARMDLAQTLRRRRWLAQARTELEAAAEVLRRTLGATHRDTMNASGELAGIMAEQGEHAAAEAEYRAMIAAWTSTIGAESAAVGIVWGKLGNVLYEEDRLDEAAAAFTTGRDIVSASLGADHPTTLALEASVANTLLERRETAAARDAFRAVLVRFERVLPAGHPTIMQTRNAIASADLELEDYADAIHTLEPVITACRDDADLPFDDCGTAMLTLARAELETGDREAAADHLANGARRWAASEPMPDDVALTIERLRAALIGRR